MYFTYILKSQKDNTFYYGSTQNLDARILVHNSGSVKYTKGHRPYVLHYFEKYETRKEAMKREKYFKTINGYKWLKENKII
ncbi:MAG: GIY-YIG nuclease family protein [Ignavibacteriales bacterium]|jgi:putative endonuclease|nr:GIY-YIG nuclease family protein [Ignavibacteriales bacterium]